MSDTCPNPTSTGGVTPAPARRSFIRMVGSSAVIAAAAPLLAACSAMPDAATEPIETTTGKPASRVSRT